MDTDQDDISDHELLRRGEHPNVSIDGTTGAATVTLYFPIKSGSELITELTIRRPRAKELRQMEESKESTLGAVFSMIASLTGKSKVEIEMLDGSDAQLASRVVGFLQKPPRRTGSSS